MDHTRMDDHQIRAAIRLSSMVVMFGFSLMFTLVGLEIPSGLIFLLGITMSAITVAAMIGLCAMEVLRVRRLVRQTAPSSEDQTAGPDR